MSALTSAAVREVFMDCLFKDDEVEGGSVKEGIEMVPVDGVRGSFGFHGARLASHRDEITALLDELPAEFREGWSFLNACMDKHGRQWGEHVNVEQLMTLGVASGLASYPMPREFWPAFPGGMPYFIVKTTPADIKEDTTDVR